MLLCNLKRQVETAWNGLTWFRTGPQLNQFYGLRRYSTVFEGCKIICGVGHDGFSVVAHGISPCKHIGNNLFWCDTRSLIQNTEHKLRAPGSKQLHLPLHSKTQRAAQAGIFELYPTRARSLPPYVYSLFD
jgi:hypothetical protein